MSLISIAVVIIVIGVLMWAANQIPMAPPFKKILNVVVVVFVCLWLLNMLGVLGTPYHWRLR